MAASKCKQIGPAGGGEYRRKSMAICRVDALSNFVNNFRGMNVYF